MPPGPCALAAPATIRPAHWPRSCPTFPPELRAAGRSGNCRLEPVSSGRNRASQKVRHGVDGAMNSAHVLLGLGVHRRHLLGGLAGAALQGVAEAAGALPDRGIETRLAGVSPGPAGAAETAPEHWGRPVPKDLVGGGWGGCNCAHIVCHKSSPLPPGSGVIAHRYPRSEVQGRGLPLRIRECPPPAAPPRTFPAAPIGHPTARRLLRPSPSAWFLRRCRLRWPDRNRRWG